LTSHSSAQKAVDGGRPGLADLGERNAGDPADHRFQEEAVALRAAAGKLLDERRVGGDEQEGEAVGGCVVVERL